MCIEEIQKKLEAKEYGLYHAIIELIITAVLDYPIYELESIENYFDEVRNEIGHSELTSKTIKIYLDKSITTCDENDIWKHSSISTLFEAVQLIELKDIPLKKVMDIM